MMHKDLNGMHGKYLKMVLLTQFKVFQVLIVHFIFGLCQYLIQYLVEVSFLMIQSIGLVFVLGSIF